MPYCFQAKEWIYFAKDYISASSEIAKHGFRFVLPLIQLTGQAMELVFKSCLLSVNKKPITTHNLITLYKECEKMGFELDDNYIAFIIHLNHHYFSDLFTGTKYKSRYPTIKNETLGGALPSNEVYVSIMMALLDKAEKICKKNIQEFVSLKKHNSL